MNTSDKKYTQFNLPGDMLASADIMANFDADQAKQTAEAIAGVGRLLMTGEGSSRLFPAKSAIAHSLRQGWALAPVTEAGRQAQEYDLSEWAVFAASNSGKTSEVIGLFDQLKAAGHEHRYSLCATDNSPLESRAKQGFVLTCGDEGAVAATKSVIEQALFFRALLEHAAGRPSLGARLGRLGPEFRDTLEAEIDPDLVERVARAGVIYWAGRNDGVAEELTLKTNEITRKPADYLEGTYAVHGIEEVMNPDDVVIWIDPYEQSEAKFRQELVDGVGLSVIAISSRATSFPTIRIPDAGDLSPFLQMVAGWSLLVEVGLRLGVNLDKPQRARKVGNEFEET